MGKVSRDARGRGSVAASEHDSDEDSDSEKELLDKEQAKEFRGLVARLNFMSQDSPDLQFTVKQVSREMSNPVVGSWKRLKKNKIDTHVELSASNNKN